MSNFLENCLVLTALCLVPLGASQAFDPRDCHRIGSVSVPVQVTGLGETLEFAQDNKTISLSETAYRINKMEIYVGDAAHYYQLVKNFFKLSQDYQSTMQQLYGNTQIDTSRFTPAQWQSLVQESEQGRLFYEQSLAMCKNILALSTYNQSAKMNSGEFVEIVSVNNKVETPSY